MNKAVMLSIRPEWCAKIANSEKTMEIRKTRPKLKTPFKCYIYCSGGSDKLWVRDAAWRERWMNGPIAFLCNEKNRDGMNLGNGRVIGEFVCDGIEDLGVAQRIQSSVVRAACMAAPDIHRYLAAGPGYAWKISSLCIYDKPRELKEFRRACESDLRCESCALYREHDEACGNKALHLRRPPQSWGYVEEI